MIAVVLCVDVAEDRGMLDRAVRDCGQTAMHVRSPDELASTLARGIVDLLVTREGPQAARVFDAIGRFAPSDALPAVVVLRPHGSSLGIAAPPGASGVLTTPVRKEAVRLAIAMATEHRARQREAAEHRELAETLARESVLVGQSTAMRQLLQQIATVAYQEAPVLIVGEPGSGKTLVARAVHARSARRTRPLVFVSCGAQSGPALEETLFGRPAAHGHTLPGAVRRARLGMLVLEDLQRLDAELQTRVLQAMTREAAEPQFETRVLATEETGAGAPSPDCRRATPLARGTSFEIVRVPPLRERIDDLPLLVGHFVDRVASRFGVRPPEVLPDALERLERHPWPGNVRELENVVERALIARRTGPLDAEAFAAPGSAARDGGGLRRRRRVYNLAQLERLAIRAALAATSGHQGRAARLLGISPRTLRRRLRARGGLELSPRQASVEDAGGNADRSTSIGPEPGGIGSGTRGLRSISSEGSGGGRERARPDASLALGQPGIGRDPSPGRDGMR
jgi:DNA-binding NtrC family response regulator